MLAGCTPTTMDYLWHHLNHKMLLVGLPLNPRLYIKCHEISKQNYYVFRTAVHSISSVHELMQCVLLEYSESHCLYLLQSLTVKLESYHPSESTMPSASHDANHHDDVTDAPTPIYRYSTQRIL